MDWSGWKEKSSFLAVLPPLNLNRWPLLRGKWIPTFIKFSCRIMSGWVAASWVKCSDGSMTNNSIRQNSSMLFWGALVRGNLKPVCASRYLRTTLDMLWIWLSCICPVRKTWSCAIQIYQMCSFELIAARKPCLLIKSSVIEMKSRSKPVLHLSGRAVVP